MEHALRADPLNKRLSLGLGSARRRAERSQLVLESMAETSQVDLIRYRLVRESDLYAVEAVADSVHAFQRSFTGAADYVVSGPKGKARYSRDIEEKTRLNIAYTFPGSLGIVLAVENNRSNLFRDGEYDAVVDVFDQFLTIQNDNEAIDASRRMGSALISQLCRWVDVNSRWQNSIEFVLKLGNGIQRGGFISKDRFYELSSIFGGAVDEEPSEFYDDGILVGLDLEVGNFHFVVPNGESYKGALSPNFIKEKTVVGAKYRAHISENLKRVVATGVESRSFTLNSLLAPDTRNGDKTSS